jgi:hypothetical protein
VARCGLLVSRVRPRFRFLSLAAACERSLRRALDSPRLRAPLPNRQRLLRHRQLSGRLHVRPILSSRRHSSPPGPVIRRSSSLRRRAPAKPDWWCIWPTGTGPRQWRHVAGSQQSRRPQQPADGCHATHGAGSGNGKAGFHDSTTGCRHIRGTFSDQVSRSGGIRPPHRVVGTICRSRQGSPPGCC